MLKPTTGELLAGIAEGLRAAVLPELADGHGRRQLKSALHALARLQRSWDLHAGKVVEDNEDIHRTLSSVVEALRVVGRSSASCVGSIEDRLASLRLAQPSWSAQASMNAELQSMLITVDDWMHSAAQENDAVCLAQRRVLARLFSRMVDRELAASGMAVEGA